MRIINSAMVEDHLDYPSCTDAMAEAMRSVSAREAVLPLRWGMPLPDAAGIMGIMPGCAPGISRMGIKVVNILPANRALGRSSHTGSFMLFDQQTGEPLAVVDAAELTARRTAAASALATRELARADSRHLAILGCGELALHHIKAIAVVRAIESVSLWNRTRQSAESLASHLAESPVGSIAEIHVADDIPEALASADIVCSLTGSPTPIIDAEALSPGVHLNAVGSSDASKHEIDSTCITAGQYFVDYRPSAREQAGELIELLEAGKSIDDLVAGEIGEVLNQQCPGRTTDESITIYRSLGVAAQDIYAANLVLERIAAANACGQP